jgi:hypothetical protein
MYMTQSERHEELCRLEWSLYQTLHEQFADFESYRRVRLAELQTADGTSGLTEAEREARHRYLSEWNSSTSLREEFGGNLEPFLAYRRAVDKGSIKDE